VRVVADRASALAELRRRGMPDVFDRVWAAGGLGPLGCIGREPDVYFGLASDLIARVPGAAGLCPLWEQHGEAIVGHLLTGVFVRVYYEDAGRGDDAIERVAGDYGGLVAWVLEQLAEAGLDEWSARTRDALGAVAE
jgi:hypothetical protein